MVVDEHNLDVLIMQRDDWISEWYEGGIAGWSCSEIVHLGTPSKNVHTITKRIQPKSKLNLKQSQMLLNYN